MPVVPLPTIAQLRQPFRCPAADGIGPGERVSEAVHLARLAAGDDRCCGCPHRPTDGDRPEPRVRFNAEGQPRGRLHRELTLDHAAAWLDALGAELADAADGASAALSDSPSTPRRLAFARDDRTTSARLAAAIEYAARHGIEAIDLGTATRPVLESGVRRLGAAVGVNFTAGCHPSGWAGLDLVTPSGASRPLPEAVRHLTAAQAREHRPERRRSRRTHPIRSFDALVGYAAERRAEWDAIAAQRTAFAGDPTKPGGAELRVALAGGNEPTRRTIHHVLAFTPVRVVPLRSPEGFDVAVKISRDGRSLAVLDENAKPIAAVSLAQSLSSVWRLANPDAADEESQPSISLRSALIQDAESLQNADSIARTDGTDDGVHSDPDSAGGLVAWVGSRPTANGRHANGRRGDRRSGDVRHTDGALSLLLVVRRLLDDPCAASIALRTPGH